MLFELGTWKFLVKHQQRLPPSSFSSHKSSSKLFGALLASVSHSGAPATALALADKRSLTLQTSPCSSASTRNIDRFSSSLGKVKSLRRLYSICCHSASPQSLRNMAGQGDEISYLTQKEAVAVDEELMGPLGFSIDQLMELAGLSVACALAEVYPAQKNPQVLVICGPGNNGGDGLVAARHLHHFGYRPSICYPKRTDKALYKGLVTQLESLCVPFVEAEAVKDILAAASTGAGAGLVVVDAVFGFSFSGSPRAPFDSILALLARRPKQSSSPSSLSSSSCALVSVDIPSGWHVEEGDVNGLGLHPDVLVSLTAPKLCARKFRGPHHFLGGRFIPPAIVDKYRLRLPTYPGSAMCVRIITPSTGADLDVAAMRQEYGGGGQQQQQLTEEHAHPNPVEQFSLWFADAVAAARASPSSSEPNAMTLATAAGSAPSARTVLLKAFDNRGFVWFSNYSSRKGVELEENANAALAFWWDSQQRAVRIEGVVEKVAAQESDEYWSARPRSSRISALASAQSQVVSSRRELEEEFERVTAEFKDRDIPRPRSWGGYRLRPLRMEFWQGRQSRMHDRLRYTIAVPANKASDWDASTVNWKTERLAP